MLKTFLGKMSKIIFYGCFGHGYLPIRKRYLWQSCVFVTEEYHVHKISEQLIDFANVYAKENGFNRTYIPSEHVGLYEKYGYHYHKDIVNLGNGIDRLYVKELRL